MYELVLTKEEEEMKVNALKSINEWIANNLPDDLKSVMLNEKVSVNGRLYKLSVSKEMGIAACGLEKYSMWLYVGVKGYRVPDLSETAEGTEIVKNWSSIKSDILNIIQEKHDLHNMLANFQV